LSRFAVSFIEEQLLPRLENANLRIEQMKTQLYNLPADERATAAERIDRLGHWLGKGAQAIPWLTRFLKT
jgi:hypothetical protein